MIIIKVPLLRHQMYISPSPLTAHLLTNNRIKIKIKGEIPSQFWSPRWTCYGQFYWTKLSGYHIHTKTCKFDSSKTILGPFEKLKYLLGTYEYSTYLPAETSLTKIPIPVTVRNVKINPRQGLKLTGHSFSSQHPYPQQGVTRSGRGEEEVLICQLWTMICRTAPTPGKTTRRFPHSN